MLTEVNKRMCERHIKTLGDWLRTGEGFDMKFDDLTTAEQVRIRKLLAMASDIAFNPISMPTAVDKIKALPDPENRQTVIVG